MLVSDTYFQNKSLNTNNLLASHENWSPDSWKKYPATQQIEFKHSHSLRKVLDILQKNNPLIDFNCLHTLKQICMQPVLENLYFYKQVTVLEQFKDYYK